jgi:predicted RNA-binding Zn ribbon-like protein
MKLTVEELPLVGGHASLDLVNTVERGDPAQGVPAADFLVDPAALLRWATRSGLIEEDAAPAVAQAWTDSPQSGAAALHSATEIREALHTVFRASIDAASSDTEKVGVALETIHSQWLSSAGRSELVFAVGNDAAGRIVFGNAPQRLVQDRLVEAAMEGVTSLPRERIHRCPTEFGGCGWLFLDQSRNGSRRWCRMADCGSKVKADRLTDRRRLGRLGSATHG